MSLCSTLLACNTASACTPTVADIADIAGVPLVPDVLTFAGLPAIAGVPGVTYLGILDGRLPMTQVGSLRECRCPGVVHTGDLPPVSVVIQVGTTLSALCFL
jgi:hypothetical protein